MSRALAQALASDPEGAVAILDAAGHTTAAAEVRAGHGLAQVLSAHRLVPAPFLAAFKRGAPAAVQPIAEAAESLQVQHDAVLKTTRAALVSGGLAWAVMLAASVWVLPTFFQQLVACSTPLPGLFQLGLRVFGGLNSAVGLALTGIIGVGLWVGAGALWRRLPAGRRATRAYELRGLASLVAAGVEVPDALRRLDAPAAADAIDAGTPIATVLTRGGWVPRSHQALVDAAGAGLAPILAALATTAEIAAAATPGGRWIWTLYALIVGGVAALFACLIMLGSVTVLQCLA